MSTDIANPTVSPAATMQARSPATRAALMVAAAALAAGIAADGLMRVQQWGINLVVFALVCCALSAAVARWTRPEGSPRAWMAPLVLVAALCAWRDADPLKALEVLCIALILSFAVLHAQGGSPRLAQVGEYVMAFGRTAASTVFGGIFYLADTRWSEVPRPGASRHAPAILRGLAITVPLAFVFGALLSSADAGFQRLVDGLFGWEMSDAFTHVLAILAYGWAALGTLRALHLVRRDRQAPPLVPDTVLTLGQTEIAMVLGMLDLMFLAFVVLQVRWLFGGAAVVASSPTLGYAEYARRGFFELVAVAALVLPLLLGLHWTLRSAGDRQVRVFRVLAGAMVALLFVMMASALRRMWLYQQAYGLTEMRVISTAFMLWLAVVFAWFVATVLRGRQERFVFGAVAAGVAVVVALHTVDPDGLIVRVNLARDQTAIASPLPADQDLPRFDAVYAARLSGDGVPTLIAALPSLPPVERCGAARILVKRWLPAKSNEDWRSWSWGRSRAQQAASRNAAYLRAACNGVVMPPARPEPQGD